MKDRNEIKKVDDNKKKKSWIAMATLLIQKESTLEIKFKVPMASPNSSIYKTSATIILRGKPITEKQKKEAKFLEFLSRAPISFDKGDDS